MNGLVRIDKPEGPTSHDIVNRWRRLAGTRRVGHLGTLDPMATGLLLLLTGTSTRLAPFFEGSEKTYSAEIELGVQSDTYDAEGAVVPTGMPTPESWDEIEGALKAFRGKFLQTPPAVSAKKIQGVPAYKLARKNIDVELRPTEVQVKRLEATRLSRSRLQLLITCSAGTYIRSIAHDLGKALGCGGILAQLRRTQIGDIKVDEAKTVEELEQLARENRLQEAVTPPGELLQEIPAEHVPFEVEMQVRQGRDFRASPFVIPPGTPRVRVLSRSGTLIAIAEVVLPNVYHPSLVLQEG